MLLQEPLGLVIAIADDLEHLSVNGLSGSLAEWLCAGVTVRAAQVRVLPRRQLYQSDPLAHAPARDHPARQPGGLLNIAFRASCFGAVNDLFGRAASQHSDDPRAQIGFRIVIAVAVGALIGHTESLSPRHDRHPIHRVGAGTTSPRMACPPSW